MVEDQIQPMEQEPGLFAPAPQLQPCSWLVCTNGHKWPPAILVAKCPGCQGPFLAVQQQNCPFCNEPVLQMSFRVDVVPAGAGGVPRCKGARPFGESIDVVLDRQGHQEAISNFKTFLQKEAMERTKDGKDQTRIPGGSDLGGCISARGLRNTPGGLGTFQNDPSQLWLPFETGQESGLLGDGQVA
ncbi:MAG: hypothetical protein KGI27_09800 [Thaumarchaeota archaeon]|nr:hypothetical protein [Nitrososphaerota archaeon]